MLCTYTQNMILKISRFSIPLLGFTKFILCSKFEISKIWVAHTAIQNLGGMHYDSDFGGDDVLHFGPSLFQQKFICKKFQRLKQVHFENIFLAFSDLIIISLQYLHMHGARSSGVLDSGDAKAKTRGVLQQYITLICKYLRVKCINSL